MLIYSLFLLASVTQAASSIERECVPAIAEGADSQYVCGKTGHLRPFNPKSLARAKSCTNDYVGCYIQCSSTPGCSTFSYNSDSNVCRLFSKTPKQLRFVEKAGSTSTFYDYTNCFAAPTCQVSCPSQILTVFDIQARGAAANGDRLKALKSDSGSYATLFADPGSTSEAEGQTVQSFILDSSTGFLKTSDGQYTLTVYTEAEDPQNPPDVYTVDLSPPDYSSDPYFSPLVCEADSSGRLYCSVDGHPQFTEFAVSGFPLDPDLWALTIEVPNAPDPGQVVTILHQVAPLVQ